MRLSNMLFVGIGLTAILSSACSKPTVATPAQPQAKPQPPAERREDRVGAKLYEMGLSFLGVEIDLQKGEDPAHELNLRLHRESKDWVKDCLNAKDVKAVLLKAHPGKKLDFEKEFGPFTGPVKGEFEANGDKLPTQWHTYGQIDLAHHPIDEEILIVRIRPINP